MDIYQLPDLVLEKILKIMSIDKHNCLTDDLLSKNVRLMGGEKKKSSLVVYTGIPVGRLTIDHPLQIVRYSYYLRGRYSPFFSDYGLETAYAPNRMSRTWRLQKRDTTKENYCISGEYLQAKYNDEQDF